MQAQGLSRELAGPPPVTLVADVSLTIDPGSFVAIVGRRAVANPPSSIYWGCWTVRSKGPYCLRGAT